MIISYSLFFVTMLVILKILDIKGASDYNDVHGEDWIDPDPLSKINCDRTSKFVIKESRNLVKTNENSMKSKDAATTFEGELKLCKQALNNCTKQLHDFEYSPSSTPLPKQNNYGMNKNKNGEPKLVVGSVKTLTEQQEQSKVYMKRFISILLKVSKLNEDMPKNLDTSLHISVTTEQLSVLQKFSKGSNDVTLQELDGVLSSVLLSASSNILFEDYIPWFVVTDFVQSRQALMALVLGCLPVFLIWKVLNGHSLIRVMMIFLMSSFIISFSVTYCRMYKQAELKQYAAIKKNPEIPVECRPPSELTWMETIGEIIKGKFSSQPDTCQKYYEVVMLDPFLEVTPALVLSEMIAGFFLHPSGMIGSAIANFSNSILGNLPFGANWLVLILSFFLVIALIFASCGGAIKLPFYLGGVELTGGRPNARITSRPQTSQGVEQLDQPSVHPVLKDTTITSLMQTATSTDTGLVIMNISGIQRLLSSGNTTLVHRDTVEEIHLPSLMKKDVLHTYEQSGQLESEAEAHVPGCCGESLSRCHHPVQGDEKLTVRCGLPQGLLRKNRIEELRLRKTVVSSESKDKHSQIEREIVVADLTTGILKDKRTGELLSEGCSYCSAGQNILTSNAAVSTGDSSKVSESNAEDEENKMNTLRKSSVEGSDEETGFVKL